MPDPEYRFSGFADPNFTPTPDVFYDEIAPNLTEAELRVLIYILRRTYGFKKRSDDISLKQLVDGITTRDGRVLDQGTGMSKSAVIRGLAGLETKEIIIACRNQSAEKGNLPTTYSLRFATDPLSSRTTRGGSPGGQGLVLQDYPQETVIQETDEQRFRIELFIRDFARQLKDRAPLSSSVTRALNLYLESGYEMDSFIDTLYEARRKTLAAAGIKNRMSYMFEILERDLSAVAEPTH